MTPIIDAKGQLCPKPLILAKKQLVASKENESFIILIDNETSKENVERFLSDNGIEFSIEVNGDVFSLTVTKNKSELIRPQAESYCPIPTSSSASKMASKGSGTGYVISFKSDKMGAGDDDLGDILIQGCINTIEEMNPLPSTIVFYNSGIKMALEDSAVIETLQKLEKSGIKILVCGTCADYFNVKAQVKVGIVSNMYDILESLTAASHVVSP